MIQDKNILLGVTGGIAAYKACALTSKLTQAGANVKVMMSEHAMAFVSPLTFQALSRNPVYTDTFDEKDVKKIAHIDVADWADIVLIAPATANIIGKMANGIADDMLSTTLLATQASVYIAPAMNVHMYSHQAVRQNMKQLDAWGYHFIEPGAGYLACGYVGKGRLEEPESIIQAISDHQSGNRLLEGKKVLVSAGPTQERVDPVRFFTNHSSGKMGFALADAAAAAGADVTIVSGPTQEKLANASIHRVDITTAEEMYQAMHGFFQASDIVIKAAAVADFRPKQVSDEKMKKHNGNWQMEMERTTDILQALGEEKTHQFLVGFAAETTHVLEYGKDKLQKKHLDAIVVNNISTYGAGFRGDTNVATYINKTMQTKELPRSTKREMADNIIALIKRDMKDDES